MIGGSGVNDYLYGGAGASTPRAMDIITNFDVTKDLIDLTGISGHLAYVGQITGTKLAAHSVGWKPISGNTFAYVNTSSSSESITGTNMKIELLGSLSLTSSNILHPERMDERHEAGCAAPSRTVDDQLAPPLDVATEPR